MNNKSSSASRGDMVMVLYGARSMKGVNEIASIVQDKTYLVDSIDNQSDKWWGCGDDE
jgi:hypothetical protein